MKVNIVDVDLEQISAVDTGNIIYFSGQYFIVTDRGPDVDCLYAVNVETGKLEWFKKSLMVRVMKGEINIK